MGAVLLIVGWAFVDNVNNREWVLAATFGVMTLSFIIQLIGVFWIRRANRRPEEGEARDRRI